MLVLGIETSCDETAASVTRDGRSVLSNVVRSQVPLHRQFGGVVPEIASRAHAEELTRVIDLALEDAAVRSSDLDGIAVANRPGLIGALLVGVTAAKTLAWVWNLPLAGVSHVEAHLYAASLGAEVDPFPAIGLVISGGHTALYDSTSPTAHRRIGWTTDDAVGESFDKSAAILGLGYPGGPAIAEASNRGNPRAIPFPRTLLGPDSLDFSFSGLKTAVLYYTRGQDARRTAPYRPGIVIEDVAASFQEAVVDVLVAKASTAMERFGRRTLLVGGGVAANRRLRERLAEVAGIRGDTVLFPPPGLSTDNAAMIAGLGYHRLREGRCDPLDLDAAPS